MKKTLCVVALIIALCPTTGLAVLVVPMTFEQLVAEAAAVVYARVSDVRGQWTADRQSIDSHIELAPLQYLKGNLGPSIAVRLPGGEANGKRQVIPGAPVLKVGELVIVFLKARGPAMLTPLGFTQGVFRVVRDARTGTMIVTPPPLKESSAGRILRGAVERRALTIDAFAAAVRTTEAR